MSLMRNNPLRNARSAGAEPPVTLTFSARNGSDEGRVVVDVLVDGQSAGVLEVPTEAWNSLRELGNCTLGHQPEKKLAEQSALVVGMVKDRHAMDEFDWQLLGRYAGELVFMLLRIREIAAREIGKGK